jgi:hypothetical protein
VFERSVSVRGTETGYDLTLIAQTLSGARSELVMLVAGFELKMMVMMMAIKTHGR